MRDVKDEIHNWLDVFLLFTEREFGYIPQFKIKPMTRINHIITRIIFRIESIPYGVSIEHGQPCLDYNVHYKGQCFAGDEYRFLHDIIHLYQAEFLVNKIKKPALLPHFLYETIRELKYRLWSEGLAELYTIKVLDRAYRKVRYGRTIWKWDKGTIRATISMIIGLHLNVLFSLGVNKDQLEETLEEIFTLCDLSQETKQFSQRELKEYSYELPKGYIKAMSPYSTGLYYSLLYCQRQKCSLRHLLENPVSNNAIKTK